MYFSEQYFLHQINSFREEDNSSPSQTIWKYKKHERYTNTPIERCYYLGQNIRNILYILVGDPSEESPEHIRGFEFQSF